MSNSFGSSKKSKKNKFKKSLPVIGVVFLVVAVLGILIIPNNAGKFAKCNELKLGANFFTLFTGGCEKSFDDIIFVVGDTQNTPKPQIKNEDFIDIALNADNANIYAISVSNPHRRPKLIASHEDSKRIKEIKEFTIEKINKMSATNDGADYLSAIITAARHAEHKDKTLIYIIGSGLSDRGLLNFPDDKLLSKETNQDDIVNKVLNYLNSDGDNDRLLTGLTIFWDGIGQTALPQKVIEDTNDLDKLADIYSDILSGLGAKSSMTFKSNLDEVDSVKTDKTVKIIDTTEPKIIIDDSYSADKTTALQFNDGEATFKDWAATTAEIEKHANEAKTHPSAIITITAYASRGGECRETPDMDLLNRRLDAVRKEFESRGIKTSRIKTIAAGFGDAPDCINGIYNDVEAQKNRRVDINTKN